MCEDPFVIVDFGSDTVKAGLVYTADCYRLIEVPSVFGLLKNPSSGFRRDTYFGEEAVQNRNLLTLRTPTNKGIVTDWFEWEMVLQNAFNEELHIGDVNYPMLMIESPLASLAEREQMTQVLMETFHCPQLCAVNSGTLSLFSSGRTSGVALQIGHTLTYAVPVNEGKIAMQGAPPGEVSGIDLTDYLMRLLSNKELKLKQNGVTTAAVTKRIKESWSYVPEEWRRAKLPDGQHVKDVMAETRHECCEALFNPSLIGRNGVGIHQMVKNCVRGNQHLFKDIVLSGGSSLFPTLPKTLETELRNDFNVVSVPGRKYASFIGASIVASLPSTINACISQADYDEYGPTLIHRKCPV